MQFLQTLLRWFLPVAKTWGDLVDLVKPKGFVEMRLIHAHGPQKGQVARVIRGRNVVTGFLKESSANDIYSGRDIIRRLIVPSTFAGALSDDVYKISQIELGSGNSAETSADEALETPIGSSRKDISSVTFDATNTYVTFYVEYDESEVNTTIAEAALRNTSPSNGGDGDFLARKTFGSFTKTSDYILQVRWTIRI